ncbi:hypothetical protein GCM10010193_70680 [Kitasatospora atroaurantiaca]|uniref:Uncharacterized protein n=1 Tax=Kitasatospora atroaurantiaca TaxID=285545 RepID=A0A561ENH1_9ACTN|nr:hypothetical protein [Kitasatospora atroaurantiaca]TWE17154.1 hypothetical protein FB465_2159 [Kitasatospora atroaurantiaca]
MSLRWHALNNEKVDGHKAGTVSNRSFWLGGLPRLILLCRVFGHRPVVDGYGPDGSSDRAARWVACHRCGLRPNPQAALDPSQWSIGARYTGPFSDTPPPAKTEHTGPYIPPTVPGRWPAGPTGTIGGQLILGKSFGGASIELKVGNAGSEHVLAVHLRINPIFALYLHTEDHGTWLQRRLNPRGYDSRVTGLDIGDGRLSWKLWAKRDEWSRSTPRWQQGSTVINLLDRWLGPVRHEYDKIGQPRPGRVTMPEGDTHMVELQLEKVRTGRRRGRKTESWSVDWTSRAGIPFRNHTWKGDGVHGSAVKVSAAAVERGRWPEESCARIAASVAEDRSRCGWRPAQPYGWPQPNYNAEFDVEVF